MNVNDKQLIEGAKSLFRIHLRPADTAELKADDFCLAEGIVGFGWPIKDQTAFATHEVYRAAAHAQYVAELPKKDRNGGYERAMNGLLKIQDNDLIWTRTRDGRYYLGRVFGPWTYNVSDDHLKADICNYKQCEWIEIGTVAEVIGTITNRFIGRATLTQVHCWTSLDFSVHCWNNHPKTKTRFPVPQWDRPNDLLEMITHEDCEDIVGLYLQHTHGYYIIPSTNKRDTLTYEFELLHQNAGEMPAVVQVKQGKSSELLAEQYQEISKTHKVFLFQSGLVGPAPFEMENVVWLSRDEIEEFMANCPHLLPARVRKWVDFADRVGFLFSLRDKSKLMTVEDLQQVLKNELNLLTSINDRVKKAIEPLVEPLLAEGSNFSLKGNEVVGWLGELYAATLLGGEIESDDKSYDILVKGEAICERIEVKTRRQSSEKSNSWKRSGVISVDEKDSPTHVVFVKLDKDYRLDEMYKFGWQYLEKEDRLKEAKSNENKRGYYIVLAPTKQEEWMIYPKTGSNWSEKETK